MSHHNSHEATVAADFNLASYTSFERKQFTLSGLYPLETRDKWALLVHKVKFALLVVLSTVLAVSMIVALILGVENLSDVTAILYYLITQSAYLLKLINFTINRGLVLQIEAHLRDPVPYKFYAVYGRDCLDSSVRTCMLIGLTFRVCCLMCLTFFILTPLLRADMLLPFAGWMPVSKEDYRVVLFSIQISCFFASAATNSSLDIYTSIYISIAVGELRLLKICLANVDYARSGDDATIDATRKLPTLPAHALEEIVHLHKHAIAFNVLIDEMFSNGIFIQFLASIAVICMTGFQMLVVDPFSLEFCLLSFYFACMMCQIILYCWYGNEVLFESGGIGEACYMSNWYEAEPRFKKVLLIMMERSKRPIILTAGSFFILSLTTLLLIMKSSYSYFAVLQRFYKGD